MFKYTILFILSTNLLANDIIYLKMGDLAPTDGFLFSKETEQKARKKTKQLEYSNLKLQDLAYNRKQQIDLAETEITLYKTKAQELSQAVEEEKSKGKVNKVFYFILGVLTTGVAAYGVSKISK